jgi:hypothetical protein
MNFRFKHHDGTAVNLGRIALEMSVFFYDFLEEELKCDEELGYMLLDSTAIVGIATLMRSGGFNTTPEDLENHLENSSAGWRDVDIALFREFLVSRYIFEAWH